MNPDLEGRSSDRVLYILVSESNSVVPDLHMEKLDDLCFKKRFGLCNLNASCMRFSKETSFPKDCQVRSEMPSSHILGCCLGTGQRGTWHLWCNQTHWACLQRTLDQAKLACVTNWWISGNFKFGKYQQSISFGWRRVGLHLVAMMLSSGHPITLLDHANGTKEPKHRV